MGGALPAGHSRHAHSRHAHPPALDFHLTQSRPCSPPHPHPRPSSPAQLHPNLEGPPCHICQPNPIAVKSTLRASHTRQRSKRSGWPHPLAAPRSAAHCLPEPAPSRCRPDASLLPSGLAHLLPLSRWANEALSRASAGATGGLLRRPLGAQSAAGPSGGPDVLAGDKGRPCNNALCPRPSPPKALAEHTLLSCHQPTDSRPFLPMPPVLLSSPRNVQNAKLALSPPLVLLHPGLVPLRPSLHCNFPARATVRPQRATPQGQELPSSHRGFSLFCSSSLTDQGPSSPPSLLLALHRGLDPEAVKDSKSMELRFL